MTDAVVRVIQRVLVTVLLLLVYLLAIPLTWLVWAPMQLVRRPRGTAATFWRPARGYELTRESAKWQS